MKTTRQDAQRHIERVLVDIVDNPLQPSGDRAARLGLNIKTVQRAIKALVDEKSVTWGAGRNAMLTPKGAKVAEQIRHKVKPGFDPLPKEGETERGEDPFD